MKTFFESFMIHFRSPAVPETNQKKYKKTSEHKKVQIKSNSSDVPVLMFMTGKKIKHTKRLNIKYN